MNFQLSQNEHFVLIAYLSGNAEFLSEEDNKILQNLKQRVELYRLSLRSKGKDIDISMDDLHWLELQLEGK